MGTTDYMHRSGIRYRHPCGAPEQLYYYSEPAPADVHAEWVEFKAAEHADYLEWCARKGFEPTEINRVGALPN